MAVASLLEVMDELADQIRAAMVAVTDVDVQVEPRIVPNPTPPTIDIYPGDPPNDVESAAMADAAGGDFLTVRARVATGDSASQFDLLVNFMDKASDLSVAAAVFEDTELNGLARVSVQSTTGLRQYIDPEGQGQFLGCEWTVLALRMES
jgi:hypothetical protein